jgi:hypothetical protein
MSEKSASRAIHPREARVVANTTLEIRERLERIAESNRWSLSKTAHLALVEGLRAWEERDRVPSDFSGEGRGRARRDSDWSW